MSKKGVIACAGAAILWGLAPIMSKSLPLDGIGIAFYRLWFGAGTMTCLLLIRGGSFSINNYRGYIALGLIMALNQSLFYSAIIYTNIANVTVIHSLVVIPTLILAPRKLSGELIWRDVIWIIAAILGVAFVIYGSSMTPVWNLKGDILAAVGLFGTTAIFIVSKMNRQRSGVLEYLAPAMLLGAIAVTFLVALSGTALYLHSTNNVLILLLFSIVDSSALLLLNWAHGHIKLWVSAILMTLGPVVAASGAFFVLGEPILAWQVLGIIMVIIAIRNIALANS